MNTKIKAAIENLSNTFEKEREGSIDESLTVLYTHIDDDGDESLMAVHMGGSITILQAQAAGLIKSFEAVTEGFSAEDRKKLGFEITKKVGIEIAMVALGHSENDDESDSLEDILTTAVMQ